MTDICEALQTKGYLILDGALGSEVKYRNPSSMDPYLWSAGALIDDISTINGIHLDYIQQGADIITTSSYQISYESFQRFRGYSISQTNKYLLDSINVAHSAKTRACDLVEKSIFVASSIGCYGAHLADGSEYHGEYGKSLSYLMNWHEQKLNYVALQNPNIIACETIPCKMEAIALTKLIANSSSQFCSWISLACKSETLLNSGESIEDTLRAIEDDVEYQLEKENGNFDKLMIGVNCTDPIYVEEIINLMKENIKSTRVLVAYPNRGCVWNDESKSYVEESGFSDDQFAECAKCWLDAGARIIGGCCCTTPLTISKVKSSLAQHCQN
eukprot:gene5628-7772_t